ncbi:hypothetical protein [Streptomyces sp. NPDC018693]|uniref:hypothetical protein n=1 Tax=unclassified Streptomyces TaxID=2593676 RepID=UPI0037912F5A
MGPMPESVPVRCPACRSERVYTAPSYPCACGAPITPVLDRRTAPAPVLHRAWEEEWIRLRCPACARVTQWPRPELGCGCGAVLRIPVQGSGGETEKPHPPPRRIPPRTARDAVTATVLYLHRLGHRDVRRADQRPPSGIALAARGLFVQVDPSRWPASSRDVECLWLTAMADSASCVHFSLAGYTDEARARAALLGVPLFVLGPTGTPVPVNDHAAVFASSAG